MKVVVKQNPSQTTVTTVGIQGPPGPVNTSGVAGLTDVDSTEKVEGSVLVYKENTQKWTSTTLLNNQTMDAGEF
jgi:hypothetical protein